MSGIFTNGVSALASLTGVETAAFDTNNTSGINPESGAVSVNQLLNGGTGGQNLGNLTGNVTVNGALGNYFYGTLTGNITLLQLTNPGDGQKVKIKLTQDGTGSRTLTLGTGYLSTGNITLTTAAAGIDILNVLYDKAAAKSYATLEKTFA